MPLQLKVLGLLLNMNKEEQSSAKRQKMEAVDDRISVLPDKILLHILSLLRTNMGEMIRTGTLSKRWQYLWNFVPIVAFFQKPETPNSDFVSLVDLTLIQCRHSNLKLFDLCFRYDHSYVSEMTTWISYAIASGVEELKLSLYKIKPETECHLYLLPDYFYRHSCFTRLLLEYCDFIPKGSVSWKMLESLVITESHLTNDAIEKILSGCPLLELVELSGCFGFDRLNITSKSVKELILGGIYPGVEEGDVNLSISAPNILFLDIKREFYSRTLEMQDLSSTTEVALRFQKCGVFDFYLTREEAEENILKGILQSLCVKKLKKLLVGTWCAQVLCRLLLKGFHFPMSTEPNVDKSEVGDALSPRVDVQSMSSDANMHDSEAFGIWRGHKVLKPHAQLLQAVEQQYPETFVRLKVRVERVWETFLGEFGRVITCFLRTPIYDLTADKLSALRLDLDDLERYGFDIPWAFERLRLVEQLLSLDTLASLDSSKKKCSSETLSNAGDEKAANDQATTVGRDFHNLLRSSVGVGLLPGYKAP